MATCLRRHGVLVLLGLRLVDRLLLLWVLWIVRGEELIRLLWLLVPIALVGAVETEMWRLLDELRLLLKWVMRLVVVLLLICRDVR